MAISAEDMKTIRTQALQAAANSESIDESKAGVLVLPAPNTWKIEAMAMSHPVITFGTGVGVGAVGMVGAMKVSPSIAEFVGFKAIK